MKNIIKYFVAFALFTGIFGTLEVWAQCKSMSFLYNCAEVEKDYIMLKSHEIQIKTKKDLEKNIFSIAFMKGMRYKVSVCDENIMNNRLVVTIYDGEDKPIKANWSPDGGMYYSKMVFECNKTGNYYIGFSFQGGKPGCGIANVSYKKKVAPAAEEPKKN